MKLQDILEKAHKMNEFYLYYTKLRGVGTTYLEGTMDLDNRYILARAGDRDCGLKAPIKENVLEALKAIQEEAVKMNKVMLFSWTNYKFRFLDAASVRKMIPLAVELKNAGKR